MAYRKLDKCQSRQPKPGNSRDKAMTREGVRKEQPRTIAYHGLVAPVPLFCVAFCSDWVVFDWVSVDC